jgi:protein-tyrosine phosphatase/membrane-associated phospholipid phosphatase
VLEAAPNQTVHGAQARRPWGLALWLLAGMGALFFSSYGLANWAAGQRAEVPFFYFDWEPNIPFVPWSIVPYWSIDLLYGLSFFLWRTRAQLLVHVKRLLMAQLVSVACFLAFPMRFAFERPAAVGLPGQLFDLLGGFDRPFNQAPSLHISLLVILWVAYAAHARGAWRGLLHGWFALIGISVLTTYQHHFIDVPTGWLVGWLCVFAWPMEPVPAPAHPDSRARHLARRYAWSAAAFLLLSLAALRVSVTGWLLLAWTALALACVAVIYWHGAARAFQKRADGRLPLAAYWVLAPYLIGAWINSRAWTRGQPPASLLAAGVWVGRWPSAAQARRLGVTALVDLCAELPRYARVAHYRCVPVLDLTVPRPAQLREAVRALSDFQRAGYPVLVCCALGYSRSALVAAAWLARHEGLRDAQQAVARLRACRPQVTLGADSMAALESCIAWYCVPSKG